MEIISKQQAVRMKAATYCSGIRILYLIRCHMLIAEITSASRSPQLEN